MKENKVKYNWEKDFKECTFDSKEEFLWIYVLGGCGCGNYDENIKIAWKVFELFATPFEDRKFSIYDKPEYEIIAHWLDSKNNLIEHGTSVAGSWLTEEGEKLYALLKDFNSNSIKLTPEQRKHLNSIEWLFNEDNRQKGRSFLLAYIYITEVLKGRTIKIIDHAYITHGGKFIMNKHLADRIDEIIKNNHLSLKIDWSTLELKLIKNNERR